LRACAYDRSLTLVGGPNISSGELVPPLHTETLKQIEPRLPQRALPCIYHNAGQVDAAAAGTAKSRAIVQELGGRIALAEQLAALDAEIALGAGRVREAISWPSVP
jgi:hypothetical protein